MIPEDILKTVDEQADQLRQSGKQVRVGYPHIVNMFSDHSTDSTIFYFPVEIDGELETWEIGPVSGQLVRQ